MKNIRNLLGLTRHLRGVFLIVGVTSVLTALLNFGLPYIIKLVTDWLVNINAGSDTFSWNQLALYVGLLLIVTIMTTLVGDIGGYFGDLMAVRVRRQLSAGYFSHLLQLPQHYFDGEVTGKIINRLSRAITDIAQFLQFFANNLLQMLLTMMITIGVLFWFSWPLGVLFLILIPANLYLTGRSSGKWQRLEAEKNKHFDIASGRFAEVVSQIRLVKSFSTERRELSTFDSQMGSMIGLTKQQSRHWHLLNAARGVVFGVVMAAMYGILFYETAKGAFSIGDLALLLAIIQQASFPLLRLSFFVDSYQRAAANSKDYLDALKEAPEPDMHDGSSLDILRARIEYSHVDFSYTDKETVLENVDFVIEPGQKLALVGESGGGKTTISNLLMGLYSPNRGSIKIDGTNIASVSKLSLRSQIATVFQDAGLFSGTIRENIAYARPDATDEEIEVAAKAANVLGFVNKLDKRFETEIGERGIKLSGGQKQRLAIARAILKDAPILILDEATSSLDSKSEAEVQKALDHLMKDRTVLIIAHRLSTIAHVDTIVTLKDGKIDEIGTPQELATSGGIYSELLQLQLNSNESAKKILASFDIAS